MKNVINEKEAGKTAPSWNEALTRRQRLLQKFVMRLRPAFLASWLLKVLKPERVVMRTKHSILAVDPNCQTGVKLTTTGQYEKDMADTLKLYLKPGFVFADVGANEGYFTVLGSLCVGDGGRVVSVEPQARLLPVIRENLDLNGLGNVSLINVALSDEDGNGVLFLSPSSNSGASGLDEPSSHYHAPKQEVAMKRLETVLNEMNLEQVDFMKMDIEGFEYEAVLGSEAVFRQHRIKALVIEMHGDRIRKRGKDPMKVIQLLEDAGYRLETPHKCWVFVAS